MQKLTWWKVQGRIYEHVGRQRAKRWCVKAAKESRGLEPGSVFHKVEGRRWSSWYVACYGMHCLPQSCEKPGEELSQQKDAIGFAFWWITVFRALSLGEASSECHESHTSFQEKYLPKFEIRHVQSLTCEAKDTISRLHAGQGSTDCCWLGREAPAWSSLPGLLLRL